MRVQPLLAALCCSVAAAHADAAAIARESFDYRISQTLDGQTGGIGFNGGWLETGAEGDYDVIQSGSLGYPSLGASGNSLSSFANETFSTGLSRQLASAIAGTDGTTLWVSYLIRKESQSSAPIEDYFGLVLYPSDPSADALFVGDTGESDFYSLGVAGSADGQVPSNTKSVVSTAATLLVAKITFAAGADRIDLYVDPDVSQGEPDVSSATKTDLDIPDIAALGILAGLDATWSADEIRVGRQFVDVAPAPTKLANISTRLSVQSGENVLIGGFIVTGAEPKKVIVRAIGPSLPVEGHLADPVLEVYSKQTLLASNDDWVDSSDKQAIMDSTVAPHDNHESAVVATLPANGAAYTAVVKGVNGGTGVGLVEVYDLDQSADSKLANISTRGLVQTGDNVMIGGLIVLGHEPLKVIVRAIGPSLAQRGVQGALPDPNLEVRDGMGNLLAQNDNWRTAQEQEIIDTTVPPGNDLESAVVRTLAPGNYTALVRGNGGSSGVALVEVYALQ